MVDDPAPPPPDLEEFCKEFGGIGHMNAERWVEWEKLNKEWQQKVAEHEAALRAL
jgi:hypothetical protein